MNTHINKVKALTQALVALIGESYSNLPLTRQMIESGVKIKLIATHEPFIFSMSLVSIYDSITGISKCEASVDHGFHWELAAI